MEDLELVLIHGFGGGPEDWNDLISGFDPEISCRRIDLKKTPINETATWDEFCADLEDEIFSNNRQKVLCGYSFGGRLALQIAATRDVQGLVLLSAGLGILNPKEKIARKESDHRWAALLRKSPEEFWSAWYDQEIFSSFQRIDSAQRLAWLQSRFRWDNKVLADHLEFLGPAMHEWLLPVLSREKVPPTLYLAGEKDRKYVALSQLVKKESRADVRILKDSGHVLPIEAPLECAQAISQFVKHQG
jgi:2-succinyl-6-hydroxy-2,4-cyclohexadiene-1-carboxylate synthase